jgi:adenylate cyclase class 2
MAKTQHHDEIEIKLRVQDVAAVRSRLKRLKARKISPRTYESNTLYDTSRQNLRRRGQLIRIRVERPASSFGKRQRDENGPVTLTYKGPSLTSRNAAKTSLHAKSRGLFKINEEIEVSVAGGDNLTMILGALGMHPSFRYEKFRTTYALPGIQDLKIELDETPVGIYLELEGPPARIDRAARLLGYDRGDYMKETYGSLYLKDCLSRNRKPGDMLFPITKNLH